MPVDTTLNYVTQTLINVTGGTEISSSLPPRQNGEFRIPFVTNLRLGPMSSFFGGTQFTLLWDQPDTTESISHYNVYAVGALQNNQAPLGPYSSVVSPAVFRITPTSEGYITFFVQTQLNNGNVSDIDRSPSITAFATPPLIKNGDITPGTTFPALALNSVAFPSDYVADPTDSSVMIDATAGAVSVTCPDGAGTGQLFMVKKLDATANAVTCLAPAGSFIEAGSVIAGGAPGSLVFMYRTKLVGAFPANTWQIIAKY